MSESETKGRCRSEMTAAYKARGFLPNDSDEVIADALDRLAADVAAIKEKTVDIEWEAVQHFVESEKAWVSLVEEQRDAAIRERDEARAEVERIRAELAARPAANSPKILDSSPAAPQPAAPPAGWLTLAERLAMQVARDVAIARRTDLSPNIACLLDAILARAGSPPVVEVPAISRRDVPMQNEAFAYRDAMDKAGVKWKEVPRE